MTTNTVDWSTLGTDPASAASAADLEALAASFDPHVPTVLLPVRVETRFTTIEVPETTDHLAGLIGLLDRIAGTFERLAALPFATTLAGTVREQKRFKETVEAPLYKATREMLDTLA